MDKPCDSFIPQLSAYLDGELSPGEERALLDHLAACPDCGALLDSYRAVASDLYLQSPGPGFTDKVMARVKQEGRKKRMPFRSATLAAAVVALVLLGASGSFNTLLGRMGVDISQNSIAAQADQSMVETADAYGAKPAAGYTAAMGTQSAAPAEAKLVPEPEKETSGERAAAQADAAEEAGETDGSAETYAGGGGSNTMTAMLAPAEEDSGRAGGETQAVPSAEAAPSAEVPAAAADMQSAAAVEVQEAEPAISEAAGSEVFTAQAFFAEPATSVTFTAVITGVDEQDGQVLINVKADSDVGIDETDDITIDNSLAGQESLAVGDRVSITVSISGLGDSEQLAATSIQEAGELTGEEAASVSESAGLESDTANS